MKFSKFISKAMPFGSWPCFKSSNAASQTKGYDNVPLSREKSAVSPGTEQSGRRIRRKYRAVCAYHNVPPDSKMIELFLSGAKLPRIKSALPGQKDELSSDNNIDQWMVNLREHKQ